MRSLKINLLSLFLLSCATDIFQLNEIIQTPVDLTITPYGAGHIISFRSDNREEGFSGYGIFIAATSEELKVDPAPERPPLFCPMVGGQIPFTEKIQIFMGNTDEDRFLCVFSHVLLNPYQFVAVRARVERPSVPWSKPVIAQVP